MKRINVKQLQEFQRQNKLPKNLDPNQILFEEQRAFVSDTSPRVVACCSRQCGKSFSVSFALLDAALRYGNDHPSLNIPYITSTQQEARRIIWPGLQYFDRAYGLGCKFSDKTGDVTLPNGAKIECRGALTRIDREKIRGGPTPLAVIDEAQLFSEELKGLINEILQPMMLQFASEGRILVIGTPNATATGHFYEIYKGKYSKSWSQHHWTWRQNTAFDQKEIEKRLAEMREEEGITKQDPSYQREYEGRWVRDENNIVYSYSDQRNLVNEFDPDDPSYFTQENPPDWEYVLGVDLGHTDPTAFVLLAFSEFLRKVVVLESEEEPELTTEDIAEYIRYIQGRYPLFATVVDAGNLGKKIVEDLNVSHGVPCEPADKHNKPAFIKQINSDFRRGIIEVVGPENQNLIKQIKQLEWSSNFLEKNQFKENKKRSPNHMADAMLYAWRFCNHHFGYFDPITRLKPFAGSPEEEKEYVEERKRKLILQNRAQKGIMDEFEEEEFEDMMDDDEILF